MLKFISEPFAENTIIDQIILETTLNAQGDPTISVNKFKGAVVVDPNLGNYVVIDFTVTDAAAMNIGRIRLMSGQALVAVSEDKRLRIVKEAGKHLKIRLAAQFAGAEKCKFNTTSVNLPYATPFRDGVVRFANVTTNHGDTGWNITDNEENKSCTVYSADVVDTKISQVTESLGNLDQYAKKAEPNEFTAANNTFANNITVNGEISGTAVTDAGTGGDKHIVNVGYADNKYLSKTEASTTYLSKTDAADTYLSKTDAGNTYLTQTNAAATYLTKTDATAAAENYAKLNGGNTFTGAKNTFKEVNATKFSGNGVSSDISADAVNNGTKLPTCTAVATYVDGKTGTLTQNITALQNKDNDLQSQIDGINAGQNLADIVDTAESLAAYDISHLKAKGDSLPGKPSTPLEIGDKVQVLGGGDVQSSVYELTKGDMPGGEGNIAATNWAGYYWRYIGVYGTNAYTKAEIDAKVETINNTLGKKADKTYVDTELAKKVDKSQIITTISGDTATNENIPSASAVKTYVDTVAADLPNKYVTLDTTQEITGAKTFANGNITIANPNTGHKDKHYVWVSASGDNTTGDYVSSVEHYDLTHNDTASDRFIRARNSDYVYYISDLTRFKSGNGNDAQFNTRLNQQIGTSYKYTASDILITTNIRGVPEAQIGTPGNTGSTDPTLKENYVERIRLRKNTSTATDTAGGFLPDGQSVTDIDLFADNINNVFNNEVSFRVCTTSGEGAKTDTPVLEIRGSGVHYHTPDGNSISTAEYQLRTAGSLDFTTSMSQLVGSDSYVPTTKAVADFVDAQITGITGGTAFVKTSAPNKNQTIDSAITVTEGITVGSNEKPANLTVSGIITGDGVSSDISADAVNNGTKLPTCTAVATFVTNEIAENRRATSDKTQVGAMGLFLYTGGDFKEMGAEVPGTSLQAVGMQLPMDGVVSWSQGATMGGKWKLLNNTIAGEPCLVLAIRTTV